MSVLVETRGGIAVVTINRPQARNSVDRATAGELVAAFRAFDADQSRSVAILTGTANNRRTEFIRET